jgi:hypothetical protein
MQIHLLPIIAGNIASSPLRHRLDAYRSKANFFTHDARISKAFLNDLSVPLDIRMFFWLIDELSEVKAELLPERRLLERLDVFGCLVLLNRSKTEPIDNYLYLLGEYSPGRLKLLFSLSGYFDRRVYFEWAASQTARNRIPIPADEFTTYLDGNIFFKIQS